jgi:hypothetical protein
VKDERLSLRPASTLTVVGPIRARQTNGNSWSKRYVDVALRCGVGKNYYRWLLPRHSLARGFSAKLVAKPILWVHWHLLEPTILLALGPTDTNRRCDTSCALPLLCRISHVSLGYLTWAGTAAHVQSWVTTKAVLETH